MRRAVEGFTGLEHALERVAEVRGVRFVNDSKATNIAAARRSIESFDGGVVAIMGGRFKGGASKTCATSSRSASTRSSRSARRARSSMRRWATWRRCTTRRRWARRSDSAAELAPPGGVVLLAPACASFDMFRDYAARGEAFKEEVAALAQG